MPTVKRQKPTPRSTTEPGTKAPGRILRGRVAPGQRRQGRTPTPQSRRTRDRVIEEAARCIAEEGFAAAHTNRIAERAGVSWGVLQYHFGDKAGLMSAILERGIEALEQGFADVEVGGDNLRERLTAVVDAGWQLFRSPLARAGNEILVNHRAALTQRPADLEQMTRNLVHLSRSALRAAVGDIRQARALEGVLLAALRGFNLALLMAPTDYDFAAERRTLVEMMALHVESDAKPR